MEDTLDYTSTRNGQRRAPVFTSQALTEEPGLTSRLSLMDAHASLTDTPRWLLFLLLHFLHSTQSSGLDSDLK